MPRQPVFKIYDEVTELTWRAGLDPDSEPDRMRAFMAAILKSPLPIRRISGTEINQMGLRQFVVNGEIDFDKVNAYRHAKGLNDIELGVHLDEDA